MSTTPIRGSSCDAARQQFDFYVDNELLAEASRDVDQHVANCPECSEELRARLALRDRLRAAVGRQTDTSVLRARIQESLRTQHFPRPPFLKAQGKLWLSVAAAAAMLVAVFTLSYQRGHLRFTRESQDAYVRQVNGLVPQILRAGLGDHVHCAVFRRWAPRPAGFEKSLSDLPPQYKDLVPMVRQDVPAQYKLVQAHECSYLGRKFIHLQFEDSRSQLSVVLAKRQPGESFENSRLHTILASGELPVYYAGSQRFQVAGFETRTHLGYLVSDLPEQQNLSIAAAVAPSVQAFLNKSAA